MTTITTRTTELQAVNQMLSTIGEAPINSLVGTLPTDAVMAINILNEVNREVQMVGWKFNSSYKVSLSRDNSNKIPISANVMHLEFNPLLINKTSYDPVIRGSFLFNLATESFIWDKNFDDVYIIYLLQFEDLPEPARNYIKVRASRIYHDRLLGATAIHKYSTTDELNALIFLRQSDTATADHSIFNSLDQFMTVNRSRGVKLT